jgi:translation initiation factor 1A
MVKNTKGGSKAKGMARKFATPKASNLVRLSQDECEIYAQVTAVLGNGMCHVICCDDVKRLCHIRGKFRGRGKRDNLIGTGSWILVGLREWEVGKESSTGKLQNCDLLEVYSDSDKERLQACVSDVNWSVFITNDNKNSNVSEAHNNICFTDAKTEEYQNLIETQIQSASDGKMCSIADLEDDEEVDIDDI